MADTKLTKSAGEHWVCSVLARLGWGAALTRDGLERTDILAVYAQGTRRMIEVQVKATVADNWKPGPKGLLPSLSDREWFVFVMLSGQHRWSAPRTFVVPCDHVAVATWMLHREWITDPAVAEGKRRTPAANFRIHVDAWAGYEDRWDLMEASAYGAPVLLPQWVQDLVHDDRVGLPPGHRWQFDPVAATAGR